ncbi:MAG: Rieske 2Fe-2S domain-containing protein [Candidatus Nanopelagicaceae bacterium]
MRLMAYRAKSVIASWQSQSIATRILRLWLGITWIYGGWDKASDPSFLTPGTVNYIGNQISGFIEISPIGPLLKGSLEYATLAGWFILILEFATGICTLLFILPRFAAFVGFATSVGLWLTVTFNVKPYFIASDTAYAVMWLSYFFILYGSNKRVDINMDRRGAMRLGGVLALTAGFIGLGRFFHRPAEKLAGGKRIVKLEVLPIGAHYPFIRANGEAAILFRTRAGVFAYSAICTHQGCEVQYQKKSERLVCPCHQAAFDPFQDAKVVVGPSNASTKSIRPLGKVEVKIDGAYVIEI